MSRLQPPHENLLPVHFEGRDRRWEIKDGSELTKEQLERINDSATFREWSEELNELKADLSEFVDNLDFDILYIAALRQLEEKIEQFRDRSNNIYKQGLTGIYRPVGVDYNNNLFELSRVEQLYRTTIVEKYTDRLSRLDRAEKNRLLDDFTNKNPGAPISDYVALLLPEPIIDLDKSVNSEDLSPPSEAKILWANREQGETPVSFVRKHYGVWRDGVWDRDGLTKPALRQADFKLYEALAVWERRHPEDRLNLPTGREENDRWVERVRAGKESLSTDPNELQRFAAAARRRGDNER